MSFVIIILLSLTLSFVFALGGLGSAIALVPILEILGVNLIQAKVIGLLVTISATGVGAISNIKNKTFDKKLGIPLLFSTIFGVFIGVFLSAYINIEFFRIVFLIVLLFSATSMLFYKKENYFKVNNLFTIVLVGIFAGILSGLLGIGGGLIIVPLLLMFGYPLKKITSSIGLVISASATVALLGYIKLNNIELISVMWISLIGMIGGYLGNYVMQNYYNESIIKKILAIFLYFLAIKIIFTL